jgi:two-component system response regulator AtoC
MSEKRNIVILEPDASRRDYFRNLFSGNGFTPICFENINTCLDNIPVLNPAIVLCGFLPIEASYRFINAVRMKDHALPVLVVSKDNGLRDIMELDGTNNVHIERRELNPTIFMDLIEGITRKSQSTKQRHMVPPIIGFSPEMRKLKKWIAEVSQSNEPILIKGEVGTGRELIAKTIQSRSAIGNKPFIKLNAAAMGKELKKKHAVEHDELILADINNGPSIFNSYKKGTLLIKDICELPADLQSELLLILENNDDEHQRSMEEDYNFRVVAATSKDLEKCVHDDAFRKDLYYRLNVIIIEIPPLRQRVQDIPLLADFFSDKYCWELGKGHCKLSAKTKEIFSMYKWPGNVRELENTVKSIVMMGNEVEVIETIRQSHQICTKSKHQAIPFPVKSSETVVDVDKYVKDLSQISLKKICQKVMASTEKEIIKKALDRTNWNRKKAAALLDISYKSMLNKIKAYKIV